MCDRWLGADGFDNFLKDMGDKPDGFTLERVNNDGDYEPSNCKWASWLDQGKNKRNSNQTVGVYFRKRVRKGSLEWTAFIKAGGVSKYLGSFHTRQEARLAREEAEKAVGLL